MDEADAIGKGHNGRIAGDFACCCYAQQCSDQKSWGFEYFVRVFFE
jgi:hypothetical protein